MKIYLRVIAVVGLCFCAAGVSAADQPNPAQGAKPAEKDEKVAIADLPKAVVDAANKAQPGGKITDAEKENKNGTVVYELDVLNGGKKFEVKIDATGKVLSSKLDDDDDNDEQEGAKETEKKK